MKKSFWLKSTVVAVIVLAVGVFLYFGGQDFLRLEYLKAQKDNLDALISKQPLLYSSVYFLIYILVTALSLPGAAVMTLAGGALFGFVWGTALVSFASTIGATLAFIISRWILRSWVQERYSAKLKKINEGVERDGWLYLFSLRQIPVFPFFVVNLVMALTPMKVWKFYVVSQIGMIPGTMAYVFAGTQLASLESVSGILSPGMIAALVILAILPFGLKFFVPLLVKKLKMKSYRKHRPKSFDYNLVVIGAGSAGLVSAYMAATLKSKVALVERHKMGGDCLNTGCVPSKALIRSASIIHLAKKAKELGLKSVSIDFDFSEVMARVHRVIKQIEPHDSVERYTSLGVECVLGEAKILSPYEVQVGEKRLRTKGIVVATGARPFVPPIKGLDQVDYLTSDNLWKLKELPKRLVVLGGGPIGSELSQCFARFGSEVSIVEMGPRILSREDEEVSEYVRSVFSQEGTHVLTGHRAEEVVKDSSGARLRCRKSDDSIVELPFDNLLVAVGRMANVESFGLEELGVKLTDRKAIEVDDFMQSSIPNITACGDVVGPYQFTHAAAHQSYFAVINNLFFPTQRVDYRVMPWATFTDPEVARVGLNELEAKEKNVSYEVSIYPIDDLDRAIADEEAKGFIKVLTVPGKDQILGVTIVGAHVSNILSEMVLAMKYNLGLNKILSTIHVYPTLAESNRFVAGVWKKNHKPEWAIDLLSKYFSFRRGGV